MASVWAIGDIHGEFGRLTALLSALPRAADDVTVFLGDYIDRGPQSADVVRRVLAEQEAFPDRTILLWGNHEDMAAQHYGAAHPTQIDYEDLAWFHNGGAETLAAFGCDSAAMATAPCPLGLAALFPRLQTFYRPPAAQFPGLANVVLVHAGLLPGERPEDAEGETLLWIREEFLNVRDRSGRLVIHGHTPVKALKPETDKIGIDTGAAYDGVLTALQLPERHIYQADASGVVRDFILRG